jgi:hypothetical protein
MDDVGGDEVRDRDFASGRRGRLAVAPDHRRGRPDHRLQRFSRPGRAEFLPEAQDDADDDHRADDERALQLVGLQDQRNPGKRGKDQDEWILERGEELEEPVRLFLMRDLVGAPGREPVRGVGRGQAMFRGLQSAQRRVEVVADLVRRIEGEAGLNRRGLCNTETKHHRRQREK